MLVSWLLSPAVQPCQLLSVSSSCSLSLAFPLCEHRCWCCVYCFQGSSCLVPIICPSYRHIWLQGTEELTCEQWLISCMLLEAEKVDLLVESLNLSLPVLTLFMPFICCLFSPILCKANKLWTFFLCPALWVQFPSDLWPLVATTNHTIVRFLVAKHGICLISEKEK